MSKTVKGILASVIILLIAGFIFYKDIPFLNNLFKNDPEPQESQTPGPGSRAQALSVNAIITSAETFTRTVEVTGELVSNEFVELKCEVSGIIDSILFREGQYVRKGQPLVKVNVDELLAQKEKLDIMRNLRKKLENRQEQLLEREAISQEEYDQALAELETADADINLIKTQIRKSTVIAPFSGILGLRQVSEGAYLTPSTVIVPIYSIHPAKLEFSIPGKYSNQVKVGNPVNFRVESNNKDYTGKVYVIVPQIDPNTRTIKIRATSPNPNNELLPGQFANVTLVLDTRDNVIMIPAEALIPELAGYKVFVYKNGKAQSVEVESGVRTATEIEITSGLAPGDTVITTGILQIRSDMPVAVNI